MTGFTERVQQMLVRIDVFAANHPQLFVKGTMAGELMDRIRAALQKLSANAAAQISGRGNARRSAIDRAAARKGLRDQMETITGIARANKLTQFWMPRERGDRATLDAGNAFIMHAEPLKELFVQNDLAADFIDRLKAAVQSLEQSIKDQAFRKAARLAATAALEDTRAEALAVLQHLDPIIENLLRDDRPTLAAWSSARRLERYVSKPAVKATTSEPESPPANAPA